MSTKIDEDSDLDGPRERDLTVNNVESLRQGIIKTSRNKVQAPYTILLVGETGVGKSAVLEFIANVLIGNTLPRYNSDLLDHTNERGLSNNQSQTDSAKFYEFVSNSGIVVRFLDTPGLADTRGIQQDEVHKRSIATEIQKHIDSVNAILILANGTVPRITVGTDYTLNTLSTIFPKTLANNIAFVFTNVLSPLSWNFSQDTIPKVLKLAPQFHLDNPVALQKKYLKLKDEQSKKNVKIDMRNHVKAGEQKALEMLVKLFDWLDRLEPQPTTEIVELYEMSQGIESMITNTLAQIDQAAAKTMEVDRLMAALRNNSDDVNALANFEETVNKVVWKQRRTLTNNMICGQPNCYSSCYMDYKTNIPLSLKGLFGRPCQVCNHSLWNHHRCRAMWESITDTHVSVDRNMKKRWEAARDGKEKAAALVVASKKVLSDLNNVISHATNDLERLVERYADLSLSGNFSAQVDSAVRLLEQNYASLEKKGVNEDQLQKVKRSLDHMKRKLALLTTSKANTQKESVSIGSQRSFGNRP